MTFHPTRRLIAICVISLLLACGLVVSRRIPPRVKIFDNRLKILTTKVSRGTNHTIFLGGQLDGWGRRQLRRLGFPVQSIPEIRSRTETPTHAFLVRYTCTDEGPEPLRLSADLVGQDGGLIPINWHSGSHPLTSKQSIDVWTSPSMITNGGVYWLRLKQKSTGRTIAEVRVGELE